MSYRYGSGNNPDLMRESDIQSKVVAYARHEGAMARKLDFGQGWPDYLFLYAGRVLFIEFKQKNHKPTPIQQHIHQLLRNQGFVVLVIDSVISGKAAIDSLLARTTSVVDYGSITKELSR